MNGLREGQLADGWATRFNFQDHSEPGREGSGLVAKSCPTLATPWTVACQAPLSMGFSSKNTGVGSHFLLQGKGCWERLKAGGEGDDRG